MRGVRETIDAWQPVFRMCVTDLFDGISNRLEEIVSGASDYGSHERDIHRALTLGDRSAGRRALHGSTEAAVRAFGATTSGEFVASLSRRNRRRLRQMRPSKGRCRPSRPSIEEGKRIAEILLADPYCKVRYDPSTGLKPVSDIIARALLSQGAMRDQTTLQDIVEYSKTSTFYWDVICAIDKEWGDVGKMTPPVLVKWRQEFRDGLRSPPLQKSAPVGRQPMLEDLVRNILIWYTVEVLKNLGFPPYGDRFKPNGKPGGCQIVAETVKVSPSTVSKTWERGPWEMVREYAEFIAKCI